MPVKYLLASLLALVFVIGCSDRREVITQGEGPVDATEAVNEVEAAADDKANDVEGEDDVDSEADENSEDEDQDETDGIDQRNVRLVVEDQMTAGQIIIKEVATARDGWVSIHKSQENGGILLPDSIGEARVDSGDSEDIIVDLWEAPYVDEKLWVLLHIDNGERGQYEFPEKDQAVRKSGESMARSLVIEDTNLDEGEGE